MKFEIGNDTYLVANNESFIVDGVPESDVITTEGGSDTDTETGTQQPSADPSATPEASGGFFSTPMGSIVMVVPIYIGILFFFSRSQKKKDQKVVELQEAIKNGDEVFTSGGFVGKVVETNTDVFIIEFGTNRGVRIPVRKSEVFPKKEKVEEPTAK